MGVQTSVNSGVPRGDYIPPIYLIVEDRLAESIVNCMFTQDERYLSRHFIFSGAWQNQASCLYGFFVYGQEISRFGIPSFNVLAIDDGDVTDEEKEGRLKKVLKGDYLRPDQKEVKEKIVSSITSLRLQFLDKTIKGRPEYNHKRWFEEISREVILMAHEKNPSLSWRGSAATETLLEVIEFSRKLDMKDYHDFYDRLRECKPRMPDDRMNFIVEYVLNAIRTYNPSKWNEYVGEVKTRILALATKNVEDFKGLGDKLR